MAIGRGLCGRRGAGIAFRLSNRKGEPAMQSHRWTSAREALRALALRAFVLPAFAVFAPHAAIAAEPGPVPAPPAHIALKAARVLDVAHGAIRNQAFVLIEGNKIV